MAVGKEESAVRNYLMALRDPASLRNDAEVEAVAEKLAAATDPVERLRLQEALRAASDVTPAMFEEAFVEHAKSWADKTGISGTSMAAEGVEADVLRRAGFDVAQRQRRRPAARRETAGPRVGQPDVIAHLKQLRKNQAITVKTLSEITGASLATTRKALAQAQADGLVEDRGPDASHEGPGRSPTQYAKNA